MIASIKIPPNFCLFHATHVCSMSQMFVPRHKCANSSAENVIEELMHPADDVGVPLKLCMLLHFPSLSMFSSLLAAKSVQVQIQM